MAPAGQTEASSGLPQVHIGFVRRRPMHPERFFALVRRRFGPLDSDLSCSYGSGPKPQGTCTGEVHVLSGSGCLWFIGSDDMCAEWFFSSSASRHLLRCGGPWPAEQAGVTETATAAAGSRRVDLSLEVSGAPADVDAWKASLFSELNDCLITRAEAVALEEGDTRMLSPQCEWEEMRAVQENLSPWVVHWWPLLRVLHGITTMVTAIPGFGLLQTVGRSLATRVRTGAWARIFCDSSVNAGIHAEVRGCEALCRDVTGATHSGETLRRIRSLLLDVAHWAFVVRNPGGAIVLRAPESLAFTAAIAAAALAFRLSMRNRCIITSVARGSSLPRISGKTVTNFFLTLLVVTVIRLLLQLIFGRGFPWDQAIAAISGHHPSAMVAQAVPHQEHTELHIHV
ncbi:unnamed protein product [Symbiodinium sp. KB8]|nr:unnamed protein product [Symbiodinium sp. KB8]